VSGAPRYKYFKRPVVPHLEALAPEVLLAPTANVDPTKAPAVEPEAPTKEVGTQSQYRESETQTTPYTPDVILPQDGRVLEVQILEGLTFTNGLPAGKKQIEMIEHARKKKALEEALPPGTDEASLTIRKILMEEQEMRDFILREAEMDRAHAFRLETLRQAITERDQGNEFLAEQRVEALRQKKMEYKDKAMQDIQNRRIKVLRKLTKSRANVRVESGKTKRDIIGDYANFSSKVYAPIIRDGAAADAQASRFDVTKRTEPLDTVDSIERLETTIPLRMTHTAIRKPSGAAKVMSSSDRAGMKMSSDLERMSAIIAKEGGDTEVPTAMSGVAGAAPLPAWRTRVPKAERPATPDVGEQNQQEVEFEVSVTLLQRLLRGRAVQNRMFEGKERRIELIRELRAAARAAEKLDDTKPADVANAASDSIAGEVSSSAMDFLSKELIRKEQKDELESLARHANEVRRAREMEESGRRQAEERVRGREDEVYRQVVRTHYGSGESFIDSICEQSVENVASGRAIDELRENPELAKALLDAAQATPRTTESLTRQLVASFLMPSVEAVQDTHIAAREDTRLIGAAHETLQKSVENIALHEK
jgi:hypothetical protein